MSSLRFDEFKKMITELSTKFTLPPIASIFFPLSYIGGQIKDAQFMAISLEGGADEKIDFGSMTCPPER